tara:strand:- start:256 stop:1077 length:822 start_codon:yes stop_codon:yes gene_type:complete
LLKHIYQYDTVVIGGNLSALLYSYFNNLPLVINKLDIPHRFQEAQGHSQAEIWNKLFFGLSLSGLNLLGDKVRQVRIGEDKTLSASTKQGALAKVKYDKLIVFADENVNGLPPSIESLSNMSNKLLVLDWMIAKPCMEHTFDHFHTGDEFVKDIYFYPTERTTGVHPNKRDLVAISYLTVEELKEFEHSDTAARFKTTKIMKANGITGRKNGYANGKQIHYALRLQVEHREVRKQRMNLYDNTKDIEFNYQSPKELLQNHTSCSKLNNQLGIL